MRGDTNEEVRLVDITGLMATSLNAALREMEALARQSRSRGNFMYQANINPRADDVLSPAQMMEAVERLERNLKLAGHQRVIVEHVKYGRRHWHAIWNRVDPETLKVTDITGNYGIHTRTARELEQAFGLQSTPSPGGTKKSRKELWEGRAEEESGVTRGQVTADLTRCWREAKSGQDFRDAIERIGYLLARGDRRDFCVVDKAGRAHSLARRLDGTTTAEIREQLGHINPAHLPSVSEARARQRSAYPDTRDRMSRRMTVGRTALLAAKREAFKRHQAGSRRGASPRKELGIGAEFKKAKALVERRTNGIGPSILRVMAKVRRGSSSSVFSTAAGQLTQQFRPPSLLQPLPSIAQTTWGPTRPSQATGMDPAAIARAGAAFEAVMAEWQARIDATTNDPSMTPTERAATITALRSRQRLEAQAARRKIIEDEKQRVREAKRKLVRAPSLRSIPSR